MRGKINKIETKNTNNQRKESVLKKILRESHT